MKSIQKNKNSRRIHSIVNHYQLRHVEHIIHTHKKKKKYKKKQYHFPVMNHVQDTEIDVRYLAPVNEFFFSCDCVLTSNFGIVF